ncbi:hypothetical protein RRF57_006044 [Xylaria bambusicola]|uniref:Uncharacterized protein n=1 Tax=Xylaria bambusicola TaxID=326684 RepID=A0AAN7URV4_9PEZI
MQRVSYQRGTAKWKYNREALIDNEQNSIIAEFCRRVQAVIWNRRLFKTKNEALGLGPSNIKVRDQLAIIYGCTVLVILRQARKKPRDKKREEYESMVEILKACIKICHETLLRKLLYKKAIGDNQADPGIKKALDDYNARIPPSETTESGRSIHGKEKDVETGTSNSATESERSKTVTNQMNADKEDPLYYYKLIGDNYVHGMMDGEALRRKFYSDIPDRTFGLR